MQHGMGSEESRRPDPTDPNRAEQLLRREKLVQAFYRFLRVEAASLLALLCLADVQRPFSLPVIYACVETCQGYYRVEGTSQKFSQSGYTTRTRPEQALVRLSNSSRLCSAQRGSLQYLRKWSQRRLGEAPRFARDLVPPQGRSRVEAHLLE